MCPISTSSVRLNRADEFLRCARQDDAHPRAARLQQADEFMRLVGGDAAADDEENRLSGQ